MSTTYPTTPRADFLTWCQIHAPLFIDSAVEIGLTPAQATAFNTATAAFGSALTDQAAAQQAAKMSTEAAHAAYQAMLTTAGTTVKIIRAFAEASADPNAVYQTAQIPAPSSPKPAPPPAEPTNLSVELLPPSGALVLRWKASNPVGTSGTSYLIRRRLPGESQFSFIGVSGKKIFVDESMVAGPDWVQYTVQGQRSDSSGPLSQIFIVSFGIAPGGGMTASVSTAPGRGMSLPVAAMSNGGGTAANGNGGGYSANGNGGAMPQKTTRQRVGV